MQQTHSNRPFYFNYLRTTHSKVPSDYYLIVLEIQYYFTIPGHNFIPLIIIIIIIKSDF